MATLPDKMKMTESKEDDNTILPHFEDDITSSFTEGNDFEILDELDDIATSENKQSKPVIDKQKGVEEELQQKNIQHEECDDGKNYRKLAMGLDLTNFQTVLFIVEHHFNSNMGYFHSTIFMACRPKPFEAFACFRKHV